MAIFRERQEQLNKIILCEQVIPTVSIPNIVNVLSGPMKYISLNVTEPTNVIMPDLRGTHMTNAPEAIIRAQTTPDKLDPSPSKVC